MPSLAPCLVFALVLCGLSAFVAAWSYLPVIWGAPWDPSSSRAVEKMLSLAALQPGQTLIDLGAGDGRIVIAARAFGAQAVGVEIDPLRCALANGLIHLAGLRGRARVVWGNMYSHDCRGADVVAVYLLQGTNQKLKTQLSQQLKPGARVVSHTFSRVGWVPVVIDERDRLFVYEIGRTDEGVETRFV